MKNHRIVTNFFSGALLLVVLLALGMPVIAHAQTTGTTGSLDTSGTQVVTGLKSLASGNVGKAIFGVCLLVGCVCVISPRTRTLGIAALAVGILLGSYGGLLDGLWSMFNGSGQ
jgi:hypothetical protein